MTAQRLGDTGETGETGRDYARLDVSERSDVRWSEHSCELQYFLDSNEQRSLGWDLELKGVHAF